MKRAICLAIVVLSTPASARLDDTNIDPAMRSYLQLDELEGAISKSDTVWFEKAGFKLEYMGDTVSAKAMLKMLEYCSRTDEQIFPNTPPVARIDYTCTNRKVVDKCGSGGLTILVTNNSADLRISERQRKIEAFEARKHTSDCAVQPPPIAVPVVSFQSGATD